MQNFVEIKGCHLNEMSLRRRLPQYIQQEGAYVFAPLYDCKTYLEHDSSKLFDMSACVQSSGSFSAEKALLDHFAPRADVILFDIGLHPISSDRLREQRFIDVFSFANGKPCMKR